MKSKREFDPTLLQKIYLVPPGFPDKLKAYIKEILEEESGLGLRLKLVYDNTDLGILQLGDEEDIDKFVDALIKVP